MMPQRLFQRNAAVETAPLQQDAILFHPRINRFCILNRTSSFIWSNLQTPISPEQLAHELCATFEGVTIASALEDVRKALEKLEELDLVVTQTST